jgi:hypothetical protein
MLAAVLQVKVQAQVKTQAHPVPIVAHQAVGAVVGVVAAAVAMAAIVQAPPQAQAQALQVVIS